MNRYKKEEDVQIRLRTENQKEERNQNKEKGGDDCATEPNLHIVIKQRRNNDPHLQQASTDWIKYKNQIVLRSPQSQATDETSKIQPSQRNNKYIHLEKNQISIRFAYFDYQL